jgi:hypothetical protein
LEGAGASSPFGFASEEMKEPIPAPSPPHYDVVKVRQSGKHRHFAASKYRHRNTAFAISLRLPLV